MKTNQKKQASRTVYNEIRERVQHAEDLHDITTATFRAFCLALVVTIRRGQGSEDKNLPSFVDNGLRRVPTPDEMAALVMNRLQGGSLSSEDPKVAQWFEDYRRSIGSFPF